MPELRPTFVPNHEVAVMRRIYQVIIVLTLMSLSQASAVAQSISSDIAHNNGYFSSKGAYTGPPVDVAPSQQIVEQNLTNAAVIETQPSVQNSNELVIAPTMQARYYRFGRYRPVRTFSF